MHYKPGETAAKGEDQSQGWRGDTGETVQAALDTSMSKLQDRY